MKRSKEVFVIAGPNGAGKTTFAISLIDDGWIDHFVNADEIAKQYSNLPTKKANLVASREFLQTLDRLTQGGESFAFETTLSGRSYLQRIRKLQQNGWKVSLFYLFVSSADISKARVAERVSHGGHHIPDNDVYRRYPKSIRYFFADYLPLVDYAECVFNEGENPEVILKCRNGEIFDTHPTLYKEFIEVAKRCQK